MPLLFFLAGADEIVTVDLRSLLQKSNLKTLFEKLLHNNKINKFNSKYWQVNSNRINQLETILSNFETLSISEILAKCNIVQMVGDASQTKFKDGVFDVCYSVNVLEHVDVEAIFGLSKEFYRIGKSGSFHYHAIGVYDHFVHVDKSISKFNYLKFSETKWEWIDNGIQPQNRKRISYFRTVFSKLGYKITAEILWKPEPEELAKIKVHSDFKDETDLDIPYGTFILTK